MKKISSPAMIIFDHDGTLVYTNKPQFHLFPGIKELLSDLSKAGFTMSVWTARSHRSTFESLKNLGIADYFDDIYGHDDGMAKPHPMGLAKLSEGFERNSILHIGDSLGDVEGAQNFGISVIAACWNSSIQVENFKLKTPYVAMKPMDCREIISQMFQVDL